MTLPPPDPGPAIVPRPRTGGEKILLVLDDTRGIDIREDGRSIDVPEPRRGT